MLITIKNGQTSVILRAKLLDSSATTGAGLTGLTFSSGGLIISTIADNEAAATTYTAGGSTIEAVTTFKEAGGPGGSPATATRLHRVVFMILTAWILAKVLFVLYEGFFLPENTSDSWEHWSSGAKFFYYEKGLALDPANEHFFGAGYLKV